MFEADAEEEEEVTEQAGSEWFSFRCLQQGRCSWLSSVHHLSTLVSEAKNSEILLFFLVMM